MPAKPKLKLPPIDLGSEAVGKRIARLRKERGYTQAALAKKIGTIQVHVSRYERDERRLYAEMVARFARALDVTADELLGMVDGAAPSDPLPPKLRRRMQRIAALSPSNRKAVLKMIDGLLTAYEK